MNHHEEARRLYDLGISLGLKGNFFMGIPGHSSTAAFYIGANSCPSFQVQKDLEVTYWDEDNMERDHEYLPIAEAEQRIRKLAEK